MGRRSQAKIRSTTSIDRKKTSKFNFYTSCTLFLVGFFSATFETVECCLDLMHAPAIIRRHFILSYVHPTTYGLRPTFFTRSSSNMGLVFFFVSHKNRSTISECISFASLVLFSWLWFYSCHSLLRFCAFNTYPPIYNVNIIDCITRGNPSEVRI